MVTELHPIRSEFKSIDEYYLLKAKSIEEYLKTGKEIPEIFKKDIYFISIENKIYIASI